jgi:hypothetical protein
MFRTMNTGEPGRAGHTWTPVAGRQPDRPAPGGVQSDIPPRVGSSVGSNDAVVDRLRSDIVSGVFSPGGRLIQVTAIVDAWVAGDEERALAAMGDRHVGPVGRRLMAVGSLA